VEAFLQGRNHRAWKVLGAHLCRVAGEEGVHFALWAPNARQVELIGGVVAVVGGLLGALVLLGGLKG